MVAAAMLINSGWELWIASAQLRRVDSPEQAVCYDDVTINAEKGKRSTTLFLIDKSGKRLDVCSGGECYYSGWGTDLGKRSNMCYVGSVLVNAAAEGVPRLIRSERVAELRDRIWLHKLMLGIGVLCMSASALLRRKGISRRRSPSIHPSN
jgi:hypothetical protein